VAGPEVGGRRVRGTQGVGRRVLVTGANGFIGSHVVDVLEESGDLPVPLLRRGSDARWLPPGALDRAVYATLDDGGSLGRAVRGCDAVLHVAGAVRARSEEHFLQVNAGGTRRLLEAVVRAAPGIERFVLVSSLAAVGPSPDGSPVDEDSSPCPITSYGRSKLEGERVAAQFADRLPITIVRPPAVYGPRDRGILAFFRCARRGFLPAVGRGERRYSLVHGRDLAEGIVLASRHPAAPGRTFFLCEERRYTFDDLLDLFGGAVGRRVRRRTVPVVVARALARLSEALARVRGAVPALTRQKVEDLRAPDWTCSPRRAREAIGFRASTPLGPGLRETANWYRDAGWLPARSA